MFQLFVQGFYSFNVPLELEPEVLLEFEELNKLFSRKQIEFFDGNFS